MAEAEKTGRPHKTKVCMGEVRAPRIGQPVCIRQLKEAIRCE